MADDIKPVSIPEPLTATVITNDEPVSSRIPTTPGRQRGMSDKLAHHDTIDDVVQLLHQVAQKQRPSKTQDQLGRAACGHSDQSIFFHIYSLLSDF